jgi:hypothetical protein
MLAFLRWNSPELVEVFPNTQSGCWWFRRAI